MAPARVLDLATGSGDLALTIAKLPQAEIIGADFSAEMLAVARAKGVKQTVVADALQLPFPDKSFDVVTVAFGLRNMADWGAALREMAARPLDRRAPSRARFFASHGLLRQIYRLYLHRILSADRWVGHRRRRRLPIPRRVN